MVPLNVPLAGTDSHELTPFATATLCAPLESVSTNEIKPSWGGPFEMIVDGNPAIIK